MRSVVVLIVLVLLVYNVNASKVENLKLSFATGYIINGKDAIPGSAPYIISLSRSASYHSHICGGTIISKDWILTAGHCVSSPVGMGVVAGLHDRTVFGNISQSRVVDFGKVHSLYDGSVGPYDIALLHVSKPFVFNRFVQAAVLPHPKEIHWGNVTLYGWGKDDPWTGTLPRNLQTVETDVLDYDKCKEILPPDAPLDITNVCSGSRDKGISACNGDSGGPLVRENYGTPSELVGIVSWGYIPCGAANYPSVYTRTSAYYDWISEVQSAYYALY